MSADSSLASSGDTSSKKRKRAGSKPSRFFKKQRDHPDRFSTPSEYSDLFRRQRSKENKHWTQLQPEEKRQVRESEELVKDKLEFIFKNDTYCVQLDPFRISIPRDHVQEGPYDHSKSSAQPANPTSHDSEKALPSTAKKSRETVTVRNRTFKDWRRKDEDDQGRPLPNLPSYSSGLKSEMLRDSLPLGADGQRRTWNMHRKQDWPDPKTFQTLTGEHGSMVEAHPSGEPLFIHIKGFIKPDYQDSIMDVVTKTSHNVTSSRCTAQNRSLDSTMKSPFRAGQVHVTSWFAQGHEAEPPKPSTDITKNHSNIAPLLLFFERTRLLSFCLNGLFERVNPSFAASCIQLRDKIRLAHPEVQVLQENPGYMPGAALHWNSRPPKSVYHTDKRSTAAGFDIVFSMGPFKKAEFLVPELGFKVILDPGDAVIIKGAWLHHKIGPWDGDGRFVLVPFTHGKLFAHYGVKRHKKGSPLFGTRWKSLRREFPAKKLVWYRYHCRGGLARDDPDWVYDKVQGFAPRSSDSTPVEDDGLYWEDEELGSNEEDIYLESEEEYDYT